MLKLRIQLAAFLSLFPRLAVPAGWTPLEVSPLQQEVLKLYKGLRMKIRANELVRGAWIKISCFPSEKPGIVLLLFVWYYKCDQSSLKICKKGHRPFHRWNVIRNPGYSNIKKILWNQDEIPDQSWDCLTTLPWIRHNRRTKKQHSWWSAPKCILFNSVQILTSWSPANQGEHLSAHKSTTSTSHQTVFVIGLASCCTDRYYISIRLNILIMR